MQHLTSSVAVVTGDPNSLAEEVYKDAMAVLVKYRTETGSTSAEASEKGVFASVYAII